MHVVESKHFFFKAMFLTMLIMYSAFVLTSVSTKYYEQNLGRIFEYYVYFWGAGDLIEEVISCFVSFFNSIFFCITIHSNVTFYALFGKLSNVMFWIAISPFIIR